MKTSKFLTALMLPAMFAACTAEDIVTTNNVAQSERPMLSKDFRLISEGEGEGVNSRFYMAGTSSLSTVWEDGDKYGAALIDQYLPLGSTIPGTQEKVEGPEDWPIISSLAGNIPFIYDATAEEWKAVAATGVGHYLFSFPYNINDQNRAAVSWELPVIQELYNEAGELDLNATINKYNKSVAAALLTENATSHSVQMRNLFSYPKFVIKFDNGMPVTTVSQVVLEYADGTTTFATKGGFNHQAVWNMFNPEAIANKIKENENDEIKDVDSYWATKQTADFVLAYGNNYAEHAKSQYIVAKLPENHQVVLDSERNKCVEVRFMIPGSLLTAGAGGSDVYASNFKMHVYTNNGVYTINDVADAIEFKSTTPVEVRKRVFARNASYTLSLNNITSATKPSEALSIVTDVEDWNALVNKYGDSKAYKTTPLQVAVVGDAFTLNADAKMPSVAIFQVTTDLTIDGTVTLNNVKAITSGKKVIVAEGATLNIADNSNLISTIENNGTLNFKKCVESRAEVVKVINGITTVENMPNAVLNVEEDAEVAFVLNNNIDVKTNTLVSLEHGKVVNNGVITLKGGKNVGEFVNNAYVIGTTAAFTNENEQILGICDEKDHEDCEHFTPIFTNNGTLVANNVAFANEGEFINAATGNVSCAGSTAGQFNNSGYVKATEGSTLLITSNTGVIELDKIAQDKWSLKTAGGTILYYAKSTDTSLSFANSAVNKLVIGDQSITITATNKLASVEMGSGTLTLPKYAAVTSGTNSSQLNGSLTVKGDAVIVSEDARITGTLTVKEDASLTIGKGSKLFAATTANSGAVLVAGTFETNSTQAEAEVVVDSENNIKGIFKSTQGSTGNITFDKDQIAADETAEANAKTAYEAALVKAIEAWITDVDNNAVDKVSAAGYDLNKVDDDNKNLAAEAFTKYYNGGKDATSWGTVYSILDALETKLGDYNDYLETDVTVTSSWSTAVATVLTHFAQGGCEDADEDGKIDQVAGWIYDLSKLSWTPTTYLYLDIEATATTDAETAEEQALEDFKAAVYAGTVLNNGTQLSSIQKVLLNTNTTVDNIKATLPKYSVVFEEDTIYQLYKEYFCKYGVKYVYVTGEAGRYPETNVEIKEAIAKYADSKEADWSKVGDKKLYEYVTANAYAVYDESLEWDYATPAIIAIIKSLDKTYVAVNVTTQP